MEISKDLKDELITELTKVFPSSETSTVDKFHKLQGADTETFSFSFNTNNHTIPLILRVYRRNSNRAKIEFSILSALKSRGISVPSPYLWKKNSETLSRSFLIMEQIPGKLLSDYIFHSNSDKLKMEGITMFIREMVHIHNYDWRNELNNSFSFNILDIKSNPYVYVYNLISFPKRMTSLHNINDLKPLIDWLDDNKVKTENLSLLHGDYHMNNVIITPQKKLVVIDWADIKLGDFRHDLAFAIVATSSAGTDVQETFVDLYQTYSDLQVTNIEYFLILSILHNLLRCYSALLNPQITGETEITKKMFLTTYRSYTTYLAKIVKNITGLRLPILEEALS